MVPKGWPPEARRLWRVLYDGDEDPDNINDIRGLPLKEGITEKLFAELLVGCLLNYKAAAATLKHRQEEFHPNDPLD